ncbi:ABC transporter permease [bacterium]|nr:ABC transporter permease [bacterium]
MAAELLRNLLRRPAGLVSACLLLLLYGMALLAPFLSPTIPSAQNLQRTYHPPTALVWQDGRLCVRLYKLVDPSTASYEPISGQVAPVQWFCKGAPYKLFGLIPSDRHLFTVLPPAYIYLLGSDATGRDVFTRLLYGSGISLGIGLVGVALTSILGLTIGGLAGYLGGWADSLAMRLTEFLMAVPGLYLLLALRAALSSRLPSDATFLMIVVILSALGWAGTARVVRGLVLSLRERPFILAANIIGQRPWTILFRHLLPNTFSYLIVAATLSVPGYILGEAALSFLGLGIQEPSSSWGLMLGQAQDIKIFMLNFWWLLTPGAAIIVTVIAFNLFGDALRDAVDPRFRLPGK